MNDTSATNMEERNGGGKWSRKTQARTEMPATLTSVEALPASALINSSLSAIFSHRHWWISGVSTQKKCTSSEESKSYPAGAISIDSKTSKAKSDSHILACVVGGDEPHVLVKFDKSGMEYHGGAAIFDAYVGGTMVQQTPKEVKHDKLLIPREVLQKSIEELDKPKQNNNEESDPMQQLDRGCTPSGQAQKEKYAKLRARQKERLVLRNTSKGILSSSRLVGPKQSSDLQMAKWNGTAAERSSLMSLKGKNVTIPNTSSHKMNGSASGFTSSTSFRKIVDPSTSRRPSGFLKRKTEINDWTELELDALWVVRRHGQGNWETMLEDPALRCFKNKTPKDLSIRWNKELLKISPFPKPTSSLLLPVSVRNGVSHSSPPPPPPLPQVPFNINLKQMVAKLIFHTLYQRTDLKMNMRPMRMEAVQTPAVGVIAKRNMFPTGADLNLQLGGYQLPRAREGKNAGDDHPIGTDQSNASEEETSEGYMLNNNL